MITVALLRHCGIDKAYGMIKPCRESIAIETAGRAIECVSQLMKSNPSSPPGPQGPGGTKQGVYYVLVHSAYTAMDEHRALHGHVARLAGGGPSRRPGTIYERSTCHAHAGSAGAGCPAATALAAVLLSMPCYTFIRANTRHSISRIYDLQMFTAAAVFFKRSGGDSHRARCALGAARVSGGRGSGGATARSPRAAGRAACPPVRGSLGPPRARRAAAVREGCGTKRCSR